MNGLLNWTGNILFFLIFMMAVEQLLPGKKYHSYIRLFSGMVLILLVMKPLTGSFHLEEQIARYFETFTFQQEVQELSGEILGIERQRQVQVIRSYEEAVEENLNTMAEEMGYMPVRTCVTIEKDADSREYGCVVSIEMEVGQKEETDYDAVQAVNPVEPVAVSIQEEETEPTTAHQEENLNELRREVERIYGLETGKVEIKFWRK